MTLAAIFFGWALVGFGFAMVREPGGLGAGACGAVILGLAYAGAFNL
jgi:hypothetical protein